LAFEEFDVKREVRRGQDRVPKDRIELLVDDLGGAEGVFVVAPSGICSGKVGEAQIVLPVLERHLEDSRLLRRAQVADAAIGIANLAADRTAGAATATGAGNGE